MSRRFPELDRLRISVDDHVRRRHLDAIGRAIHTQKTPRFRRFRLLALAGVLALLVPVMALAAEEAVPGDILYPLKLVVEPVIAVFDDGVEGDHRVREVEILHEREAEPGVVREHAELAREFLGDDYPEHTDRIDRVIDELDGEAVPQMDDQPAKTEREVIESHTTENPGEDRDDVGGDLTSDDSRAVTTTTVADETTRPADRHRDG